MVKIFCNNRGLIIATILCLLWCTVNTASKKSSEDDISKTVHTTKPNLEDKKFKETVNTILEKTQNLRAIIENDLNVAKKSVQLRSNTMSNTKNFTQEYEKNIKENITSEKTRRDEDTNDVLTNKIMIDNIAKDIEETVNRLNILLDKNEGSDKYLRSRPESEISIEKHQHDKVQDSPPNTKSDVVRDDKPNINNNIDIINKEINKTINRIYEAPNKEGGKDLSSPESVEIARKHFFGKDLKHKHDVNIKKSMQRKKKNDKFVISIFTENELIDDIKADNTSTDAKDFRLRTIGKLKKENKKQNHKPIEVKELLQIDTKALHYKDKVTNESTTENLRKRMRVKKSKKHEEKHNDHKRTSEQTLKSTTKKLHLTPVATVTEKTHHKKLHKVDKEEKEHHPKLEHEKTKPEKHKKKAIKADFINIVPNKVEMTTTTTEKIEVTNKVEVTTTSTTTEKVQVTNKVQVTTETAEKVKVTNKVQVTNQVTNEENETIEDNKAILRMKPKKKKNKGRKRKRKHDKSLQPRSQTSKSIKGLRKYSRTTNQDIRMLHGQRATTKYMKKGPKHALRSTLASFGQDNNEDEEKSDKSEIAQNQELTPYAVEHQMKRLLNEYTQDFYNTANISIELRGHTAEYNSLILLKITKLKLMSDQSFRSKDSKYIDESPAKKVIFIVHGLTVAGMRYVINDETMFTTLLDYYVAFLDKFDIFILPMANPDGYAATLNSYAGQYWNKNYSPQSGCYGVVLDRNFDVSWNKESTLSPCSHVYPGPEPFSEIETQVVRDILHQYSQSIVAYIHVHASTYSSSIFKGDAILYPHGYMDATSDDKYIYLKGEIEETIKNANFKILGVTVDSLYNWYGEVNGSSVDYASSIYGIPYAMEFAMQAYPDAQKLALQEIWKRIIKVVFNNIWNAVNTTSVD